MNASTLVSAADLVITDQTNLGIEAGLLGKPWLTVNFQKVSSTMFLLNTIILSSTGTFQLTISILPDQEAGKPEMLRVTIPMQV